MQRKVVIIGSGPAGLTAAIYTSRAGLSPLVLEGPAPGGQLLTTTEVENFPGFENGVSGPELMDAMRRQATRFGAECRFSSATAVDFASRPFKVELDGSETVQADSVIIATGATARYLGLPSETAMRGHGVSACAVCDGFFFRGKDVAVIGGGDTALEEACYLTRFANRVFLVHRRDQLRASKAMQQRIMANPKVSFVWNSVVDEVISDDEGKSVAGLLLRDVKSGSSSVLAVQGMFLGIGHAPATEIFKGQIDLDDQGYIRLSHHTSTSIEGVFACGDVADSRYRQATTAAGSGAAAAIDCERWLADQGE
ncbi:MAG TPA: thioredoxin-disulfide reductase [Myxococcota bacterium]|nr:thioredoxin-disulfide reductase [Myxococcota bacterium]